ncbi:MAG: FAD-dependent oxidoreductase [Treponema sp.]|jgi:hypothetical protein|nr:FAD-dependent oxidoreductase [Treponema sp.]
MGKTQQAAKADIIVAGAGPSGCAAAIAAARMGARVLLIERYGFAGGMNTSALVGPLMTFHAGKLQIIRGIAQEIIDRLVEMGGSLGHIPDPLGVASSITPVDSEYLKLVYGDLLAGAGVDTLFHSFIHSLDREGRQIKGIHWVNKGGGGSSGPGYFIDATGDGDLAALGAMDFFEGRESDGLAQPMTLIFKMGGVDIARIKEAMTAEPSQFVLDSGITDIKNMPYLAVSGFFRAVEEARRRTEFSIPRDRVLLFQGLRPGEVLINMTRVLNRRATEATGLSAAEGEGRRQAAETIAFLKKYIPGFAESFLIALGTQIGVRESRRIRGRICVTGEDIRRGSSFPDSIALGAFPIDIHDPGGKELDWKPGDRNNCYEIPYRAMYGEPGNLLVTGRCISATHEAMASIRISATAMALGQAAGTAAALAASRGIDVDRLDPELLQKELLRQGAVPRKDLRNS